MKNLKPNPADVFVAAIAGPTVDANGASLYKVIPTVNPAAGGEADPTIAHSCTGGTADAPEYADPAVRIAQWVKGFGANGSFYPICGDFGTTMSGIAASMHARLGF